MRIGVDAKVLSLNVTGIGEYLIEMLKRISDIDSTVQFVLYLNKPIHSDVKLPINCSIKFYKAKVATVFIRYKIYKLLREDKIDIFWGPDHIIPRKIRGIKSVITIHDLGAIKLKNTAPKKTYYLMKLFLKKCAKTADAIIAVSNFTKHEIINTFHVNPNKIFVTYNGELIKPTFVNKCDNFKNLVDKKFILFVGTIQPRKNIFNLVKAFKQINGDDVKLVLAGKIGWNNDSVLTEINNSKNIVLTGYISYEEKSWLYSNCSFVIYPSLYEGFGLPILEGLSYKKIVLCGNNSSMPEVVGPSGIYINDVNNVIEIKSKIEYVLNLSDVKKNEIINKCLKWSSKFSRDTCAKDTYNIFLKLCD